MNQDEEIRRILKRFHCQKCGKVYGKLVHADDTFSICENCNWVGEEISEQEYKLAKQNPNQGSNRNRSVEKERNPYSNNYRSNNFFNINQGNNFNPFDIFFNPGNTNFTNLNNTRTNTNQQGESSSQNRNNQQRNDPFGFFFNPSLMFNNMFSNFFRMDVSENLYDPMFSTFGSNSNFFRDNFSTNFRSNFQGNNFQDFLNQIIVLSQQQKDNKKPTSKETMKRLKRFPLTETHCKKNDKGEYEMPTCTICLVEINLGEEALLVPCGHIFHSKCVEQWLSMNNTCPTCRFELPHERNREI